MGERRHHEIISFMFTDKRGDSAHQHPACILQRLCDAK